MPGMAADFFHSLLQLLGKRKVGHRLEHIIQRPYRIPLDGILRHIGNEDQHHIRIQRPDAPGRLHPVQMLHLHIQEHDVVHRAVIFQNIHAIGKLRHRKLCAVLPGVPLHIAHQLLTHSGLVLHHCNADHAPHLPFSASLSLPRRQSH